MTAEELIYTPIGHYIPPHIPVKVSTMTMKIERVRKENDWVIFSAVDDMITPVGRPSEPVPEPEHTHIEVNMGKAGKEARDVLKKVRHDHSNAHIEFDLFMTPTGYAMDAMYLVVDGERVFIARTPLYAIQQKERGRL